MNNIELGTKINLGVKLLGLFIILLMLHNISSILNNLGIITDLFIIIGVYQTGKFLTNKEIRNSVVNKTKELIDFESFDNFVDNTVTLIQKMGKAEVENEVGPDFKFSIDDLLESNPLTSSTKKEKEDKSSFTVVKTYDTSKLFNEINKE